MSQTSLTGSESFRLRIQRSEASRAVLMAGVYAALLALTFARRLEGGAVMTGKAVFLPFCGVLLIAIAYECAAVASLRAAIRRNQLVPDWRLNATAVFEIAVPMAALAVLHFWSSLGEYQSLAAPALLLFPLTILVSVLRLRPNTTLGLGLAAAIFHAILVTAVIRREHLDFSQFGMLFSYSVLLALTAVAGMLVTAAARRYVGEAVEEAEARERASLRLANIERDLEVARQIQTGLLPSGPPQFPGFDIAGMNLPADQTGGDYYDWQVLPNGRLLVVMADVTGHGIGPALVMAVCRAYSRASAHLEADPASLMSRLNSLLHADMTTGRFITLVMAVLDPGGTLELISAGHGPSLFFRANVSEITQFGGDGLPLAIIAEETYGPSRRIAMQRGDILVLLTDGVFEWQNRAGVQFGTAVLDRVLAASAALPAAHIVDALHRSAIAHADGAPQNDDVTIVVIKRTA